MRNNGPITQQEYLVPEGATLVSTTDLKSRITYCNPSFIEVSGYRREELLGQPHNMIRHPDMPQEAFRDMWATIDAGKPWSALVKNRRKNGDHYWVVANVTPVLERGEVTGYMSVRTRVSREQVAAAEALYAVMRDEAATGKLVTRLNCGRIQLHTFAGRLRSAFEWGLAAKSRCLALVLALACVALGAALPSGWGLVAALLVGAVVPVTFAVIMPTNHKLLAPGRDLSSAETRELLVRWGHLHAVRTILSLAGTVIYIWLLLGA